MRRGLWLMRLAAPGAGGGGQPNTSAPPNTEGTGANAGGQGGAGGTTPPTGGNPPQPQAGGTTGNPGTGNNPPAPGAGGNNQQAQPWVPSTPEEIEGVNQYVRARLAEDENRRQTQAQRQQAQQDEAEKIEQGKFKDVAEQRGTRITELEKQLATEMRKRIVASHNLPDDAVDRLVGTTEEELVADAKKLAAMLKPATAPNNESGAGNRPKGGSPPGQPQPGQGGGTQGATGANGQGARTYPFQKPGDVTWG